MIIDIPDYEPHRPKMCLISGLFETSLTRGVVMLVTFFCTYYTVHTKGV